MAADPPPPDPALHEWLLRYVDSGGLRSSPDYPCNYLPGQQARQQGFCSPQLEPRTYEALQDRGFRRSGDLFYRMACEHCRACVPLRIATTAFRPTRSQRRTAQRNRDVQLRMAAPEFSAAKWDLYARYVRYQHPTTSLAGGPQQLHDWLYAPVVDTLEATYWCGDELIAVTLLDRGPTTLSSVYHFFAPEHARRSLGTYSVLAEIDWARAAGIAWYMLGYWIAGAATMDYKAAFGPHQRLLDGRWRAT